MLVKDLMTTSISCVKAETSLVQIARQMRLEDIGLIPVCSDAGGLLGVVTDRDLVVRALAQEKGSRAKDIMTTDIVCAAPDMSTHDAALLLSKHQVRRLPVVQNQKLIGMLSMADIARKKAFIDEAGDALSAICTPKV